MLTCASQAKYFGHFKHISTISCRNISIASDDLMIFAVDKNVTLKVKTCLQEKGGQGLSEFKRQNKTYYRYTFTRFGELY